jgi:hypothetical protein
MNRGRRSEKIFRDRHDGMHGNGGQVILKSNKESMTHGLICVEKFTKDWIRRMPGPWSRGYLAKKG